MIPNCLGCEEDFLCALEYQDEGLVVLLDGLGERKHLSFYAINSRNNKVVVEAGGIFQLLDII